MKLIPSGENRKKAATEENGWGNLRMKVFLIKTQKECKIEKMF